MSAAFDLRPDVPPNNLLAEQSLLGCLLIGCNERDKTDILQRLTPSDFWREAHQAIYAAILHMWDEALPIDICSVSMELLRRGLLDAVGNAAYLTGGLMDSVPGSGNARYYAEEVLKYSATRTVEKTSTLTAEVARRDLGGTATWEAIKRAQETFLQLPTESPFQKKAREDFDTLADRFFMEDMAREQDLGLIGISSGFPSVDKKTNGFINGETTVVGAGTKIGKTSFALSVVRHILGKHPIYYLSLEMTHTQIYHKLMSMMSGIPADDLQKTRLPELHRQRYSEAFGEYKESQKLGVECLPDLGIPKMRQLVRSALSEWGPELIIVDYIQLMGNRESNSRSRYEELTAISRGVKNLAIEYNVPILLLAQLNRRAEEKGDGRPHYYHLNESGAIAMDASAVLLLHREREDEQDEEDPMMPLPAEIIVDLNRNGPTGVVPASFTPGITFWSEACSLTRDNAARGY